MALHRWMPAGSLGMSSCRARSESAPRSVRLTLREAQNVAAPIPILALRVSKESPRVFAWRRSTALSNNFSACIRVRLRSADVCAGCRGKWKSETSVRLQSEILVCQLNNVFIDMEPEAWNSRSSRLRLSVCALTHKVTILQRTKSQIPCRKPMDP